MRRALEDGLCRTPLAGAGAPLRQQVVAAGDDNDGDREGQRSEGAQDSGREVAARVQADQEEAGLG